LYGRNMRYIQWFFCRNSTWRFDSIFCHFRQNCLILISYSSSFFMLFYLFHYCVCIICNFICIDNDHILHRYITDTFSSIHHLFPSFSFTAW
jgi:hypothetical protein